jgi:hypothetical protein
MTWALRASRLDLCRGVSLEVGSVRSYVLWELIRLRHDGHARLLEDLELGEVHHLRGHVRVPVAALGSAGWLYPWQ